MSDLDRLGVAPEGLKLSVKKLGKGAELHHVEGVVRLVHDGEILVIRILFARLVLEVNVIPLVHDRRFNVDCELKDLSIVLLGKRRVHAESFEALAKHGDHGIVADENRILPLVKRILPCEIVGQRDRKSGSLKVLRIFGAGAKHKERKQQRQ